MDRNRRVFGVELAVSHVSGSAADSVSVCYRAAEWSGGEEVEVTACLGKRRAWSQKQPVWCDGGAVPSPSHSCLPPPQIFMGVMKPAESDPNVAFAWAQNAPGIPILCIDKSFQARGGQKSGNISL